MRLEPKMRSFVDSLNTTNIGLLMYQVLEEFGQDKSVDFHISLSQSHLESSNGLKIDKHGNFRFKFEFNVTILVACGDGTFEQAR